MVPSCPMELEFICYPRGMAAKAGVAIVGAGNLASALGASLRRTGYRVDEVIARVRRGSMRPAQKLARETDAQATAASTARLRSRIVWFCVPDAAIASAARDLAGKADWRNKIAFHSSGALASDELDALRRRGAAVASVHPMMTFVRRSRPALKDVPFAIEGDAAAVRVARRIVKDLGGHAYTIRKVDKGAYHAWGTFASPLLIALLAVTERVAALAGVKQRGAQRRMIPILLQTLANYESFGAADAFSGPIIRGDVDTVKRHLRVLQRIPVARDVYVALAHSALRYLPAKNKGLLTRVLNAERLELKE